MGDTLDKLDMGDTADTLVVGDTANTLDIADTLGCGSLNFLLLVKDVGAGRTL
jgi:hypothetical protein